MNENDFDFRGASVPYQNTFLVAHSQEILVYDIYNGAWVTMQQKMAVPRHQMVGVLMPDSYYRNCT